MLRIVALSALTLGVATAQDAAKAVADGNNAFALEVHRILKPTEENQFFSPISMVTAFGMAEAGGRNATAHQIRNALHLPDDPARHERLGASSAR